MNDLRELIEQILMSHFNENGLVLYHGDKEVIEYPVENDNEEYTNDLGKGFYLTPSKNEAEMYAIRKVEKCKDDPYAVPIVNRYFLSKEFVEIAERKLILDRQEMIVNYTSILMGEDPYRDSEFVFSDYTMFRQDVIKRLMKNKNITTDKKLEAINNLVRDEQDQITLKGIILSCLEFQEYWMVD